MVCDMRSLGLKIGFGESEKCVCVYDNVLRLRKVQVLRQMWCTLEKKRVGISSVMLHYHLLKEDN
jgi:hypothetical protein